MAPLSPSERLAALQKQVGFAVGSDYPNLNPSAEPVPTTTLADDKTTSAPPSATQLNATEPSILFTPQPNLLRGYATYSPVLSLLVTNAANYNKMVASQHYYPEDWDTICKSGGVGPKKAEGFGTGSGQESSTYFSRDMYIDSCTVNTIVGINQDNRGSNATEINMTIIEPYGMDFIEQLYDYCRVALGESNYCQIPYMLKIEFKGFKDTGENETVPYTTKYIPIHLINMEIKVNNLGAIYQVTAIAFNDLGVTEQYGRVPSTIQLGTELALAKMVGIDSQTQTDIQNGVVSLSSESTIAHQSGLALATGTAGIAPIGTGGVMHEITSAFADVLNNVQQTLLNNKDIKVPDVYTITYSNVPDKNGGIDIGQYLFLDTAVLSNINTPTVAKDNPMGIPLLTQGNQINVTAAGQNYLKYSVDPQSGTTASGAVTYTDAHLITFNSGSSILDCLNTLILNSNYIVSQINRYNSIVEQINTLASSLNIQAGAPTPPQLQALLTELGNTPLNWFRIVPTVTLGAYDSSYTRNVYARHINYNIQPYKIYNTRSISAPNSNPIIDNRVVKEYDYIFTGNNTEILTFDLNFNNAFLTYAQFNHDTKIQGSGGGMPASSQKVSSQTSLETISSPITNGQSRQLVGSSNKTAQGIGAITPERNQAADIASTIYSIGDQIQLDLSIYGDPDYIRQDGLFINPSTSDSFLLPSGNSTTRGILFNSGEVYANVNFKVPQDINLNTGLLDLSFQGDAVAYQRNVFSGQYKVLEVTNKFEKALFTQQLNLVRFDDSHNYGINAAQSQTNPPSTEQPVVEPPTVAGIKTPLPPSPPTVADSILFGLGLPTISDIQDLI